MRLFPLRILVVLCLCLVVSPVSAVFAGGRGHNRQVKVLASRHKHAPDSGTAAVSRKTAAHVAGRGKWRQAAIRTSPARRWASLPLAQKLSAKSAIIIDGVTGEVIYAHDPDLPRQPASTIKVLTSLLAMEKLSDTDIVTPSRHAASMPRSKVYLRPGRQYTVNDLLNAVLLASANDASVALAEKVGGTESNFVALMNAKAQSLGAQDTVCMTATGLTAQGQHSTARDLAVMFNKAMAREEFAERVGRSKVKTRYGTLLRNHNKALWQVHGAEGGKTGYTQAARQTYVGKFKRGDSEVVIALMGSETMWDDVKNLVEYGFALQDRVDKDQTVARGRVTDDDAGGQSVAARLAAIRRFYAADSRADQQNTLVACKKMSKL